MCSILLCRPTQFPTLCHPCSSPGLQLQSNTMLESRGHPRAPAVQTLRLSGWAVSSYILSQIAKGRSTPMPIYFNRALCYLCFASFLYNRTTFENYISCNDLILLIAIQKKKFPPAQQPSRGNLKSSLEASSTRPLPW